MNEILWELTSWDELGWWEKAKTNVRDVSLSIDIETEEPPREVSITSYSDPNLKDPLQKGGVVKEHTVI